MRWLEQYRSRRVSPEEAVSMVRSGDRIFVSGNAATPFVLLNALAARGQQLENVEVVHVLLLGNDPLSGPGKESSFRHNSLFVGPADRAAVNEGRADYTPIHLHQIGRLFSDGPLKLDAALIQTAPPDEHGFMSTGVECLATMAAIKEAKVILVQVNEKMPRTLGDCFLHISNVSALIEVSEELPELERPVFGDVERRIGEFVAGLVDDGATLQLGIGSIPDAVLSSLSHHRDLGVHTEMVSDGIMEAVESGVVTGARKSLHPGKVVCTFAMGSRQLYRYLDNNPLFEFHPTNHTNNPMVVAQNDRLVAINSAIEIDITGQVCSDSIGTRIYSGFGGQVDFIRGAAHSKGGKPIIALGSTAQGGKISRIVPTLKVGAGVVTSRADVHYVITEHGVADLHGKTLRERALALIQIAHPDFRETLEREARARKLLPG